MRNIKDVVLLITAIILGINSVKGQYLTAAQMCIYYGQPKSVITVGSQGTIFTKFDRQGRIVNIRQGNMHIAYAWSEDGRTVTLSMYQGANFMSSTDIEISEFSASKHEYRVNGNVDMSVRFKENGAIDKIRLSAPQMQGVTTYFYRSPQEMFPYAVEQSSGDQSIKMSIIINETDDYGNPAMFTQEVIGNKEVCRYEIEYYQ